MAKGKKEVKVSGREPQFMDGARPGDTIKKDYHGKTEVVTVKKDGFYWKGDRYTSLSKIASTITDNSTNGPLFFGLRKAEKAAPAKKAPAKFKAKKAAPKARAAKAAPVAEAVAA